MDPGLSSSAPALTSDDGHPMPYEWDERNSCDKDKPGCLHNSTEWKVLVNNKMISKDTKQDPGASTYGILGYIPQSQAW